MYEEYCFLRDNVFFFLFLCSGQLFKRARIAPIFTFNASKVRRTVYVYREFYC